MERGGEEILGKRIFATWGVSTFLSGDGNWATKGCQGLRDRRRKGNEDTYRVAVLKAPWGEGDWKKKGKQKGNGSEKEKPKGKHWKP